MQAVWVPYSGRRKEHLQGPVSLTWYPMDGGPRLPSSYHFCSAYLQIKENDAGAAGLKTTHRPLAHGTHHVGEGTASNSCLHKWWRFSEWGCFFLRLDWQ